MQRRQNVSGFGSARAAAVLLIALVVTAGEAMAARETAPSLRYGVQADSKYCYDITIKAELEDFFYIRSGVLTFTVTKADEEQFTVRSSGGLATKMEPKPDSHVIGIGGIPPFPFPHRFGVSEGLTLTRSGKPLVASDSTPLPFLMGDQEMLVFETFPADSQSKWEDSKDLVVREQTGGPFPRFHFRRSIGGATDRSAKEQITYHVDEIKPDTIRVGKKYDLRTAEKSGEGVRLEMTGTGEFLFDRQQGMIRSLSMKYTITSRDGGRVESFPVTLNYRMLTAEEIAARDKKAEEAKAARIEADTPKPLASGEKRALLAALRGGNSQEMRKAADRLAKVIRDDQPEAIARVLGVLVTSSDRWVQRSAAKALAVWATPEVESELCRAASSEDIWVRNAAIEALGKIPSPRAAQAVAAQMYRSRREAAAALKAMGPVAESAAIDCLKDRDLWVRKETCDVLAEIGGRASIDPLEALQRSTSDVFAGKAAGEAIDAIRRRLASADHDSPSQTPSDANSSSFQTPPSNESTTSSAPPGFRIWHDNTGIFQIEAVLINANGGRVTLVRKDGKPLVIPLEKLSAEDQEYVRKHAR